jgi:hypothetical protein
MIFRFRCPHCNGRLKLPAAWHGRRVRCPKCDQPFEAPPDPKAGATPAADDDIPTAEVARPIDPSPPRVAPPPRADAPARSRTRRPPEAPRSRRQSVKSVLTWVLRGYGVLAVVGVMFALVQLWSIPGVAKQAEVEVFDLLLRCVEHPTQHPIEPFYVFKANPRIEKGIVRLCGTLDTAEAIETTRKGPYEHVYTVRLKGRSKRTVTATSPHLTVPADDIRNARRAVEAMYPPGDKPDWDALDAWATSLWRLNWYRRNTVSEVPTKLVMEPRDGTVEERLWLVWQVLSAGQPQAERDLVRLPALLREAYPADADRDAALAWARTLLRRLRANAADHQQIHSGLSDPDDQYNLLRPHATWVPPENEATLAWLLYQYVGLNDDSRRAARDRWLSYFPTHKAERALAYGRRVEADRRAAGEPLPPAGDAVALLCTVERFLGTDGDGERCRAVYQGRWPNWYRSQVATFAQSLYPGDNMFYVVTSGDRMELFSDVGMVPVMIVLYILLVGYGFRLVILKGLGERVLKLGDNPNYRKYRDGGGHRSGWVGRVLSYVVIPVVGWVAAMATLSQQMDLLVASPAHLFLGVYMAVLLGGTLVGVPARLIAVVLIKLGVDVEKSWLDEIIGIAIGALILRHFGNDGLSIAVYALYELLPTAVGRMRPMLGKPAAEDPEQTE